MKYEILFSPYITPNVRCGVRKIFHYPPFNLKAGLYVPGPLIAFGFDPNVKNPNTILNLCQEC